MSSPRWLIGLSCGSSLEAIDAVLIETAGIGLALQIRLVQHLRKQLPPDLRSSSNDWPTLHRQLGEGMILAAHQLVQQARIDWPRILALGTFGPFLWHEPLSRSPSSREVGMVSTLADRLGVTVISDFREQDLACGGQGMPQSALADSLLYRHPSEERLLIHLGSVSSIVWLKAGHRIQDVLAMEAGPGNRLLDTAIQQVTNGKERFDPGGRYAVQGKCIEPVIQDWLTDSYFQRKPPKSLSRSAYGADFLQRAIQQIAQQQGTLQDLLCTLTHFVVRSIGIACHRWLPEVICSRKVWLSGGGSKNGLLRKLLEVMVPDWQLVRMDDLGVPASARMATAAGVLAALTLDGVPASTPSATGAVGRMLGRITPGNPANWARCLRWMIDQSAEISLPYKAA